MAKDIYVQLTKEWGGFAVGDVVRFGYSKGMRRIEAGGGVKVKKQRAVNDMDAATEEAKAVPEVETATAPPAPENTMASPQLKKSKAGKKPKAPEESAD